MSALHQTIKESTITVAEVSALQCYSYSGAFTKPTEPNIKRKNAYLHKNGYSIINAATMYYGGAKTGKTRLLISAFKGSDYIFLDFDRNYESTINEIEKSGANYYNGDNARDVMLQFMRGEVSNEVVIIDALGAVVKPLCREFITYHTRTNTDGTETRDWEAEAISYAMPGIGINGEDTRTFFNHIVEPMTRNGNSVNFIHHTTQNQVEKMEGNKGAWLSVFDFTYEMNRETKTFRLEADRLPIAPDSIGFDNVYGRINKILIDNAEIVENDGNVLSLTPYKCFHNNKTARLILNDLLKCEKIAKVKIGKKEYLDSELKITELGQCRKNDLGVLVPVYARLEEPTDDAMCLKSDEKSQLGPRVNPSKQNPR